MRFCFLQHARCLERKRGRTEGYRQIWRFTPGRQGSNPFKNGEWGGELADDFCERDGAETLPWSVCPSVGEPKVTTKE